MDADKTPNSPLSSNELQLINAYWRAANYLSVGQIYLYDNPLLKQPLTIEHVKPRLLGHWGTTPGLNFIYAHYPWLIHRLTYRRTNHDNLHVRGYKEEGTTTTPFDMVVLNDLDRFHLVIDAIDRVPVLSRTGAHVKQLMREKRQEHSDYICIHGDDMPEIRNWKWS